MGTGIKHPVPDWVKPSFAIFDIRALWCSAYPYGTVELKRYDAAILSKSRTYDMYLPQHLIMHTSVIVRSLQMQHYKWVSYCLHTLITNPSSPKASKFGSFSLTHRHNLTFSGGNNACRTRTISLETSTRCGTLIFAFYTVLKASNEFTRHSPLTGEINIFMRPWLLRTYNCASVNDWEA